MKRWITVAAAVIIGLSHTPAIAGEAGEVAFASGSVRVGALDTAQVLPGTRINEGDALETGANGHLHIKLPDRGLLILRPNSRAVVSDYVFDATETSRARMRIVVSSGVVRSITGDWAKQAPRQFRVNTPVAALGVRGTDFTLFADQQTTRVAVNSGGIVMAPFGDGCKTDGLGPCEVPLAAELFAGKRHLVVQTRADGTRAEIVDGYKLGIHPDSAAPPSANEPAADAASAAFNPVGQHQGLGALAADTVDTNKLSNVEPIIRPALVKWGRWESLLDPNNPEIISTGRKRVAQNAHFALYRDSSPAFVMPGEGMATFQLADQESYFRDQRSGRTVPATVDNARLSVDFGRQTFETSFDVRAEGLSTAVSAAGGLFPDGRFVSSAVASNAAINGALAGARAEQAGLLFNRRVDDKTTAYGATFWTR